MSSNLPRLPIRFLAEHAEMLKSQTASFDVAKAAKQLQENTVEQLEKGYSKSLDAEELAKSQEVLSGGHADAGTDWTGTEPQPEVRMEPQFRAPGDRNIGNVLFRRNPDGTLDMDAAKNIVVDMVHKVKDKSPLTNLEEITLSVLFPALFSFVDSRLATPMAAIHLRLAPWEIVQLNQLVAVHLQAEMQYNAGLGGFPTDHRRA